MLRSLVATLAGMLACASHVAAQEAPRFEVQTFTLSARYRYVETSAGIETANQLQDSAAFRARWNADRGGRVSAHVGAFTGSTIGSSWNNTGIGTGDSMFLVRVKQLFATVNVMKGLDAEIGSLYFVRGETTEITGYDNDAYLTGERVTLRRPRELFFDEVAVTHGYLGDTTTPNALRRFDSLGRSNFRQVLLTKRLGTIAAASGDWTGTIDGTTWRAALRTKLPALLDAIRAELYLRPDGDAGGAAISVERRLVRGILATGGYANVDQQFGTFNGDRYGRGERFFGGAAIPIVGPLSAAIFYTHLVDTDFPVPVGKRLDVVVAYNVLAAFKRTQP